jgi:predicted DNA-binding protein
MAKSNVVMRQISLWMPDHVYHRLRVLARQSGNSMASEIRHLIAEAYRQRVEKIAAPAAVKRRAK